MRMAGQIAPPIFSFRLRRKEKTGRARSKREKALLALAGALRFDRRGLSRPAARTHGLPFLPALRAWPVLWGLHPCADHSPETFTAPLPGQDGNPWELPVFTKMLLF